ncbi:hypothetical protein BDV10DRAFT_189343 [Aspergillus recurvatus]
MTKQGQPLGADVVSHLLDEIDTIDVKGGASRVPGQGGTGITLLSLQQESLYGVRDQNRAKHDRQVASGTTLSAEGEASGHAGTASTGAGTSRQSFALDRCALALVLAKPFVYAYRLRECYYSILCLHSREYATGALFGLGDHSEEDDAAGTPEADALIEVKYDGFADRRLRNWAFDDDEKEEGEQEEGEDSGGAPGSGFSLRL